jgi:glyoxylase-like metal-dependent hydrolase (beta-lactamase superfamily II)
MPGQPLEARRLVVGPWQENCYLLVDAATGAALLIDPGDEAGRILEWLAGVAVQAILLAHADEDHVGALDAVRAALGVRAGLHPADNPLAASNGVSADFALNAGDEIRLGEHVITVAHTPGHTPGSVCLRCGEVAVVGDAIFPGGPGHTNSPEALEQALAGLAGTVFTWPDDTRLYPGHGQATTVGSERPGFEALLAGPRPAGLHGDVTWTAG